MEMGLFQQQTTSLVMTHELKQAIQLLSYSTIDVRDFIKEQALENPLIELSETYISNPLFHQTSKISSDAKHRALENHSANRSLRDVLIEQASYMENEEKDRSHLIYLIDSINEDGYLTIPMEEFCRERELSMNQGLTYLQMLQDMEPAGVGAQDSKECLLLQLRRATNRCELTEQMVANHMEWLASKNWKALATHYEVEASEIQRVHDLILRLDPYPGRMYSQELPHYVVPDVSITVNEEGELIVHVIDELLGGIKVNQVYKQQLLKSGGDHATYAKQKIQETEWLIQSLAQRQRTIKQAAEVIANHQYAFLVEKRGILNPLTLREVALVMGVHESTVSRATAYKYAQTPKGLLELKSLFSAGLATSGNDSSVSKQTLKTWLQEFVASEEKLRPLSDQELVQLYKNKGVDLSRRVIAKYRGELGIHSSMKRKRYEN